MSVDRINPKFVNRCGAISEPIYFPSGDHKLFGWLHRPVNPPTAGIGLVICKPFGYEALCSHRSVRAFAEAAAALGAPSLRFDYLGTGDSHDVNPQANQLEVWRRDVIAAIAELKCRTGVEQVCLLGFRLGALLAALAASHCEDATALILVAPVISGRRYLRELRMMRLVASRRAALDSSHAASGNGRGVPDGTLGVAGFPLSAATISALSEVDSIKLHSPAVTEMLVIDRSDLPAARAWTEAMCASGVRSQYLALAGIVRMALTEAHLAVVPESMIAAMCAWLENLPRVASGGKPVRPRPVDCERIPSSQTLRLAGDEEAPEQVLTERPVLFSSDPTLFGVVTEPRTEEARRRGVILLNDGAAYHVGSNRMSVSLARRWARRGYFVLRMDLAGLGDSATRPGRPNDEVFPAEAIADIRAAVEFMRCNYGLSHISLAGICSGAFHSLRAAVGGLPISLVLMVNLQNFFWEEGMSQSDLALAEVIHNARLCRERLLSAESLKRVLSGEVSLRRIMWTVARRAGLACERTSRTAIRRARAVLSRSRRAGGSIAQYGLFERIQAFDLGRALEETVANGIRIVFVFSRADRGMALLNMLGGASIRRLGDRCRIRIVEGADHIFSQSGPRAELEDILSAELFAPPAPARMGGDVASAVLALQARLDSGAGNATHRDRTAAESRSPE